jgi:integrase
MAAVRVEFRRNDLVFDATDPVFGGPCCAVRGCARPARQRGMCLSHRKRWAKEGKPDLAAFTATTSPHWHGHRPLAGCEIAGCHHGVRARGMCQQHYSQWSRAGRPGLDGWLRSRAPLPPPSLSPACRIGYCDLWTHGRAPFCANHHARWRARGHPDLDEFIASYENPGPGAEHIDLRRLPAQLRLEMQYVLQCRRDDKTNKIAPAVAQRIIQAVAATKVTSLLDQPATLWQHLSPPSGNRETGWRAFILDAHRRVEALAHGSGWEVEYPRDIWRLRNLGIHQRVASISFARIPQQWLKDLAKRWARWQLSTGLGAGTVADGTRALARFGVFLARPTVAVDCLAKVDRPLLERYLADLHSGLAGRVCHGYHVSSLSMFLRAIRQHRWDHTMPAAAVLFPEDFPKRGDRLPRALAEHVMTQLEHPNNLQLWHDPARRLLTIILMRCGLRLGDALRLHHDCTNHDANGAPYLKYFNHKMKREALVPIDEQLEQLIGQQRRRVLDRWPHSTSVLFPQPTANPDGRKPICDSTYRDGLSRWLKRCDIRDEHGHRIHVTPHQWRHTLGTRLINNDVPQEVVRRILDHDSPEMTAHYARLHDTTVRRHWEQSRKVNISGDTVTLDPDGPLAEAAWAKQRLSRATQALPNGYCGLPLAQSCPHANSCLACPMFLTTTEFLPQHRQHRQQTLQIISKAEAGGQTRMAEMNRQVADNLEKIITALEDDNDRQVVDAC